jgi:hypothetical protein
MLIFIDFFEGEVGLGGCVHVGELSALREVLVLGVEVSAGFEELQGVWRG